MHSQVRIVKNILSSSGCFWFIFLIIFFVLRNDLISFNVDLFVFSQTRSHQIRIDYALFWIFFLSNSRTGDSFRMGWSKQSKKKVVNMKIEQSRRKKKITAKNAITNTVGREKASNTCSRRVQCIYIVIDKTRQ